MRRSLSALLLLFCLTLVSCSKDSGPNQPGNTTPPFPSEGTTFHFVVESDIFIGDPLQIDLLSKIATIGGREGLYAYRSSQGGEVNFWDLTEPGEIWNYYSLEHATGDPQSGKWIRYPRIGEATQTFLVDTTIFDSTTMATRRTREEWVMTPLDSTTTVVDGRPLRIRRVQVDMEREVWAANIRTEVFHYSVIYSLIEGVGIFTKMEYTMEDQEVSATYRLTRIEE